jgi:hypothetical protein
MTSIARLAARLSVRGIALVASPMLSLSSTPPRLPANRGWRRCLPAAGFAWLLFTAGLHSSESRAAMVVTFQEVGNDVVASYSGSIDTTGLALQTLSSPNSSQRTAPQAPSVYFNNDADLFCFQNTWTVAPTPFGTSGLTADAFSIATEDSFGFDSTRLYLSSAYVSGSTISGSMTFNNTSLGDIGIQLGTTMNATFSSGSTLTLNAVPEPTTVSMLAVSCVAAGLGFVRRRRR